MEATEPEVVVRIRDALHPWVFCAFPGEVYGRRNEVLKSLTNCIGWPSDKAKYEAISLVIQYWSHGSHPQHQAMLTTGGPSAQTETAQQVQPGFALEETDDMRTLLEQILERLPNVDPFEDDQVSVPDEMCHSCERRAACEWTYPECQECYEEHCD
jgi:hypothetical protein